MLFHKSARLGILSLPSPFSVIKTGLSVTPPALYCRIRSCLTRSVMPANKPGQFVIVDSVSYRKIKLFSGLHGPELVVARAGPLSTLLLDQPAAAPLATGPVLSTIAWNAPAAYFCFPRSGTIFAVKSAKKGPVVDSIVRLVPPMLSVEGVFGDFDIECGGHRVCLYGGVGVFSTEMAVRQKSLATSVPESIKLVDGRKGCAGGDRRSAAGGAEGTEHSAGPSGEGAEQAETEQALEWPGQIQGEQAGPAADASAAIRSGQKHSSRLFSRSSGSVATTNQIVYSKHGVGRKQGKRLEKEIPVLPPQEEKKKTKAAKANSLLGVVKKELQRSTYNILCPAVDSFCFDLSDEFNAFVAEEKGLIAELGTIHSAKIELAVSWILSIFGGRRRRWNDSWRAYWIRGP